jgi:cytoskeletal protein CcmA (bactofilin family)
MFSSKKPAPREMTRALPREKSASAEVMKPAMPTTPSIIAEGTVIMGGIKTVGDIQIDGRIEGDLHAASVTLGHAAELIGDLFAERANVRGQVQGNVYAHHVTLADGAHVAGNLSCTTFEVETGARLEGSCRHTDNPLATAQGRDGNGLARAQRLSPVDTTLANRIPTPVQSAPVRPAAQPAVAGS